MTIKVAANLKETVVEDDPHGAGPVLAKESDILRIEGALPFIEIPGTSIHVRPRANDRARLDFREKVERAGRILAMLTFDQNIRAKVAGIANQPLLRGKSAIRHKKHPRACAFETEHQRLVIRERAAMGLGWIKDMERRFSRDDKLVAGARKSFRTIERCQLAVKGAARR